MGSYPPAPSELNDSYIEVSSKELDGKRICLLICGSIAAYRTPDIVRELRRHSATVQTVCSESALQFVAPMALEWCSGSKNISSLTADAEHLGGDASYDLYLVAPASYNTINKVAAGIADSAVTVTLSSALGLLAANSCQIMIAPCMHGSMHNPVLIESMKKLQELGVIFMEPRQEDGKNKLPEPEKLVATLIELMKK